MDHFPGISLSSGPLFMAEPSEFLGDMVPEGAVGPDAIVVDLLNLSLLGTVSGLRQACERAPSELHQ
jgi:hypothetical protein